MQKKVVCGRPVCAVASEIACLLTLFAVIWRDQHKYRYDRHGYRYLTDVCTCICAYVSIQAEVG